MDLCKIHHCGWATAAARQLRPGNISANLIVADPPFNQGIDYGICRDSIPPDMFELVMSRWITEAVNRLTSDGSLWWIIPDEHAALCDKAARDCGLHRRNWIIWHYTFGLNARSKFARGKRHLLYYVKNPNEFTFNADAPQARVPSYRATHGDKRAAAATKLDDDVWQFPIVCGTHKERVSWHPCQMPQALLERIVAVSSNPGDLVLDPFAGSGTTLAAAKKLGRQWLGFDVNAEYVRLANERVAEVEGPNQGVTAAAEN